MRGFLSVPGGGYYQLTAESFALFNQNPLRFLGHVIALEYKERQLPALLAPGDVEIEVFNAVVQVLLAHRRPDLILPDTLKIIRGENLAKDACTSIEARGFHRRGTGLRWRT